jgi:CheY-like chemotaxis protein
MRLTLGPEGYDLRLASSRQEALQSIEREMPDALVMDYLMTGPSPAEFIDRARSSGFTGPILLCTALHEEIELPVDDVLLKPFDPDVLASKLAALLQP